MNLVFRYLKYLWILRPVITLDASFRVHDTYFQEINNGTLLSIFVHDNIMVAVKYLKYLITTFIYEFSALKSLLMQIFVYIAFLFQNIESRNPFAYTWS